MAGESPKHNRGLSLCQPCATISNLHLRQRKYPKRSDTAGFHSNLERSDDRPTESDTMIPCGSLARIKDSSKTCAMCGMIWELTVILHRGHEQTFDDADETDQELGLQTECWVQRGLYTTAHSRPRTQSGKSAPLFVDRLSLTVATPAQPPETQSVARRAHFCIQPCAREPTPLRPSLSYSQCWDRKGFAYCGRIRPLTVDLDLIPDWRALCDRHHGPACRFRTTVVFVDTPPAYDCST